MKKLANLAVVVGITFSVISLLVPAILQWSAASALKPYGGEEFAPEIVRLQVEEFGVWPIVFRIHYVICIVAGFLMMKQKIFGGYLWLALCLAFVLFDVVCVWTHPLDREVGGLLGIMIRDVWWAVLFVISYRIFKRESPERPNQSPEPTAMSVTAPAAQDPRQP
jgi:hypothetical protein